MVMLGSRSLELNSTFDHKCVESFQDPHHSLVHIESQSILQFSHPPSVSHDPITQLLEESYMASTVAKIFFCYFFMFACL